LLIRQELDGSDIKFSLSNASADTDIHTLAEWQSRRYWVERALQDAKGLAGLDQYRITGWRGWHHHTAMVMLAILYLLTLRSALTEFANKLTLKDALEIVKVLVPQRQPTYEELIDMLREKHENREQSRLTRLKQQEQLLAEYNRG
jgi:SRSO17 transposase